MQKPKTSPLRSRLSRADSAFTLMETVIAIGVLAVLLTGFVAVFTPAAQGIRRSISSQQADRLSTTLERELVTLRSGQPPATATTGFDKGFTWLKEGNVPANSTTKATPIFVYQYRGNPASIRADLTPTPLPKITGQPGKDYIVQSMARRLGDTFLEADLAAIEGQIFFVKPTQLVFSANQMILGTAGTISNPSGSTAPTATTSALYLDAVIPFSADFYDVPTKAITYLTGSAFKTRFSSAKNPIFTRNLAIRR